MPGAQEGLKRAGPSPFPSVPLPSGTRIQLSRGSQGSQRARNQMGRGKEGFGPEWGFSPPFPHPHPPSAKAWGCQLQPETRGFLSPRTHTPPWFFPSASVGSGLGPLGRWCLKLTELPCPSCLLGEGVELAGELAQMPCSLLPFPRSSGAWCPTIPDSLAPIDLVLIDRCLDYPAYPSRCPAFRKEGEHWTGIKTHACITRETLGRSPTLILGLPALL